jgi:flagellar motor switch/type III secretory pathway protein FliN
MNSAFPIRWIPTSALESTRAAISTVTGQWAQAWGLPAPEVAAAVAVGFGAALSGEGLEVGAAGTARLQTPVSLAPALARALLHVDSTRSPIASIVGERAVAALRSELEIALATSKGVSAARSAPSTPAPGHWGASVRISVLETTLHLNLAWELMAAKGWIKTPTTQPLPRWAAEEALSHVPLTLIAQMGMAEAAVGDLAQLEVGDVILVSQTAKEPMTLRAHGTSLQLSAYLGRTGSHRAAQIIASPKGAPQ